MDVPVQISLCTASGGKGEDHFGGSCRIQPLDRREKGAETLEFALVVTVLMTLMLGIVVFARAFNIYQTITRAAREGARVAVLPSSSAQGDTFLGGTSGTTTGPIFRNYIAPVLTSNNLSPASVFDYSEQVKWLNPTDVDRQCGVVISFRYPYPLNIPFTSMRLTTLDLGTRVQMRREDQRIQTVNGQSTFVCP